MPQSAAPHPGPSPAAAYSQWIDACAAAGWRVAPAPEEVAVRDGLGRVAAAPVRARWAVPRAACAAMDGIAITAGPGGAAGGWRLPAASFTWVDTGDVVPAGMDTVVQRERVRLGADGSAEIAGPAPRGLNVRAAGEDFPAGELLIEAGRRLRPADLAAAAAAGHATLEVARRPVAVVIPTGDEVRPAGAPLAPGEVTDSNSVMLASRAAEAGADPVVTEVLPDDPEVIAAGVRRAALAADVVLVIAGSSAGRGDHTAAVVARVGGVAVKGVGVRPGHPVLLGYVQPGQAREGRDAGAVPVIGVPGYPLAAAVVFELFALPLLAALQGGQPAEPPRQRAQLACDWTSPPDVEDWVPVSLAPAPARQRAGCPVVATPGRRGAASISRLSRSHAWWRIPAGEGKFARGAHIDVQLISGAPW